MHAVVREPGLPVELVARADDEDVRHVVARRIERLDVRVREVVPGGGDEELAARVGLLDRVSERFGDIAPPHELFRIGTPFARA